MENWLIGLTSVVAIAAALSIILWMIRRKAKMEAARVDIAKKEFAKQKKSLEQTFLKAAKQMGKPRGLKWMDCTFGDAAAFAKDRTTEELCAFTPASIRFEAIEGGDMEEVEAVGNLKAATAILRHRNGRWVAEGRIIVFNLSPDETIDRFEHELERT